MRRKLESFWLFANLFTLFFLFPYSAMASDPVATFDTGNQFLKDGQLDKALEAFEKIADPGNGPDYFFNLGNVYYLKEDWGRAIQNYRKALFRNPRDGDVRMNLSYARKRIQDKIDYGETGNPLLRVIEMISYFSLPELYTLFLWSLLLSFLGVFLYRLYPGPLQRQAVQVFCFFALLSTTAFFYSWYGYATGRDAVVIAATTPVRAGPGSHFNESLSPLHSGTEVRVILEVDGWCKMSIQVPGAQGGREVRVGFVAVENLGFI